MAKKKIIIEGSTGSIGRQTLAVVDKHPDLFEVTGLGCGENYDMLNEQIEKYRPKYISIARNADKIEPLSAEILPSAEALSEIDADIVVAAMVGTAGLAPTLKAIECGKNIALANKETLVASGELVTACAEAHGVKLIPVDSEHSAIWQCINYGQARSIKSLILTASGGAFRGFTPEMLENVTAKDALKHPTWKMGKKVTVDSATLMNKGLEVIEAMHLFGVSPDNISVLIHKESIVHSMVEFCDNSIIAELSHPSMQLPIQLALTYPDKIESNVKPLDLADIASLSFERPDTETFRLLKVAYDVAKRGGTAGTVMNAADEVAVGAFIDGSIGFLDIAHVVEEVLQRMVIADVRELEDVIRADKAARICAAEQVLKIMSSRL